MKNLTLYSNPSGLTHDTGQVHPECAARLDTLLALFQSAPFKAVTHIKDADAASFQTLRLAHAQSHIDHIESHVPDRGTAYLDNDTVLCPQSLEAAMDAAGAVCRAVSDVCDGQTKRAFCAVRPPGHHATTTQAMGFCLFNNIFVCAQYALHQCDIKKVAIIDFDVHHGNGTDEMTRRMLKRLKNDDSSPILFISSHQFPFYPGSGGPKDNIEGAILNIPLAAGTGSQAFRAAYEQTVFPALYAFDPELIMLSAGFDAHKDDPLGELELEEDDFAWVSEKICAIADKDGGACKGRVVSVLEGGYNLGALKSAARAHLQALM